VVVSTPNGGITRSYPGEVKADEEANLAFNVSGWLIEFPVRRGQPVKEKDLLARLDPRDFENRINQSRAMEEEAQVTRDRYAQAVETGAASRQLLTQAEAQLAVAAAQVRIDEKALQDTHIYAPYDGIVADKLVENFEHVDAKVPVVRLQKLDVIKVVINIPERDVATVPDGDDVGRFTAHFTFAPEEAFELKVKEWVAEADEATQTYAVSLTMPPPEQFNLAPGMTAKVTWYPPAQAAGRKGFIIPATAVFIDTDGQSCVWVVDPKAMTVSRTPVDVAEMSTDTIRVKAGLEEGQTIATAGATFLREGMEVRTMQARPKDTP
jgi:RND family efflux transporter MFP subunit